MASPLIVALDTPGLETALSWAAQVAPYAGYVKLGLEFFVAQGPLAVARFHQPVFLDLKLHDIPATVAGAVRAIGAISPGLLTLHAAGGASMMAAAREAAEAACGPGRPRTRLLAVTVLTSLDTAALAETGVPDGTGAQVRRLARLALDAGADGLVCSGHEVAMLRDTFGPDPLLVVPGIRPIGAATGDQARVMTPRAALAAGASHIVVGRPITSAPDLSAAAARILAELQ